jgi:hypothetical protein
MKSENTVKIGDVVKSLDFVGVNDCYYVGVVIGISEMDGTFRARTVQRVWQGNADKKPLSDTFVAPLPGNSFFDDLAEEKGAAPRVQVVWRNSSVAA